MLVEQDKHYFINNPVFIRYKKRFDFLKWTWVNSINAKKVYVNERIVEIPYAVQALAEVSKEKNILDLGCTESPLSLNIACLGYRVTGFDYRLYPYSHPNLTVARGDILNLPFRNESFGAVYCISTLEHLGIGYYADPQAGQGADQKAVEEIFRVLERSGFLILSVPFGKEAGNKRQRIYGEEALKKLLERFKIEEMRYYRCVFQKGLLTNFWEEIDEERAGQVKSPDFTKCVCLVKAQKR